MSVVIISTFLTQILDFSQCKGCHDLMQKVVTFNDVPNDTVNEHDYTIHFLYLSKDEAINVSRNADLTK